MIYFHEEKDTFCLTVCCTICYHIKLGQLQKHYLHIWVHFKIFASFLIDLRSLDVRDIKYFTIAYMALTLYLLTWRIWWAPNNSSKGQMRFNSAFTGLIRNVKKFFGIIINLLTCSGNSLLSYLCTLVYVILKHITLRSSNVLSMHLFIFLYVKEDLSVLHSFIGLSSNRFWW